jgi:hypothetical protein
MYDTEGPYRVFLRYRLGKYRENTNRYHTEIPNRDTTLVNTTLCTTWARTTQTRVWYHTYVSPPHITTSYSTLGGAVGTQHYGLSVCSPWYV